jgi:endonuclease-3
MKKADIFEFYRRLAELNPDPRTELEYGNDYQLLVAVVLSAQATDVGVNKATRALFRDVKTPADGRAGRGRPESAHQDHRPVQRQGEERDRLVRNSGARFRRRGSAGPRHSHPAARRRPQDRQCRDELRAFGAETFAVDTHIFRVGNRTGLAPGKTPLAVEKSWTNRPRPPSAEARITG